MHKGIGEFKKSIDTYSKIVELLNSVLENTEKNDLKKALRITGLENCADCGLVEDAYDTGREEGNLIGYVEGKEEAEEAAEEEFKSRLRRLSKHFKISLGEIETIAEPELEELPPCQKSTRPF